jgi:hypothetical protein
MHRVNRDYLSTCIYVAIKTMRGGKDGKGKHPVPELRDDWNVHKLVSIVLNQVDNDSSFVCRAGPSPTDVAYAPSRSSPKFGIDEPWPDGITPA